MSEPLALLSVTDKTGVVAFAKGLKDLGFELLSTGGTAEALRQAGLRVTEVAAYTGSPEIMDGRVKTLHPRVHGGILYDRDDAKHRQEAEMHQIRAIKVVAVNLYRFEDLAVQKKLTLAEAIHHIDVGGPTMLRAAAKNWQHVLAVVDPADYERVLEALRAESKGGAGRERAALGKTLAAKVFARTAAYDQAIASYFADEARSSGKEGAPAGGSVELPESLSGALERVQPLRYGENPHQPAALYVYGPAGKRFGFGAVELLQGKELSYNNLLDLDAACTLTAESHTPMAAVIKHTNPCGAAALPSGRPEAIDDRALAALFRSALAGDPKSAFGGIVALNATVGATTAAAIIEIFTECVAAPDFTAEALAVFAAKKNLRVIRAPFARLTERQATLRSAGGLAATRQRSIFGAQLVQADDIHPEDPTKWQVAAGTLDEKLKAELVFAMTVAKHVKSNAIVYAKNGATLAVGAGQMSRIDAATFAAEKARAEGRDLRGAVLASDAFFPFRDTVDLAAKYGVKAIVQPGGSMRDQESIDAAREHGITMVITGVRHFRH
jgi:phosphoribosylaminoimidazolecarboxamide formyltransferase/IMP cyclohydrolase